MTALVRTISVAVVLLLQTNSSKFVKLASLIYSLQILMSCLSPGHPAWASSSWMLAMMPAVRSIIVIQKSKIKYK